MVDQALAYAQLGWRVFPVHAMRGDRCTCGHRDCTRQAKHPVIRYAHPEGDPLRGKCQGECGADGHGLHDATTEIARIERWWSRTPWANVAVATGAGSGIVVLDVDGMAGEQTLDELQEVHGGLPETARAITGGDGMHYFWVHPGEPVHNTAGAAGRLGPGLDFRGDGGYVVAPPSAHLSGQRYEWLAGRGPDEAPLVAMPAWLLERLREPTVRQRPLASVPSARGDVAGAGWTPYGLHALEQELAELRQTGEGGRNHALNRSAFNLGQLVAGGELDEGLVAHRLAEAAAAIGLGAGETQATIRSGLTKGSGEPRTAPPRERPAPNGKRHLSVVGAEGPGGTALVPKVVKNEEEPPNFEPSEWGNAQRLVHRHGRDIHYVPAWGAWLTWDGRRWRRDGTGKIWRLAKDVVQSILTEAQRHPSETRRETLAKWWLKSQTEKVIRSTITLAQSEPGISIDAGELDDDPWLLNCRNGVVDLRTGELLGHDRKRLITKLCPVAYDPDARFELWDRFLDEVTEGDEALLGFLRRSAGYSLTGDTGEEVLFFTHGPAATGKSTYLDALRATWGEYATTADFETFLQQHTGGGARNDIARLAGARLVVSIEVDEGKRLAEGLMKTITGGDTVTARFLYRESFEFRPAFKLHLAANDAPRVSHDDEAMWRRILRVPFEHRVPKERRDPNIKATLRDPFKAGPAILAWAVRGCIEWQRQGLGVPLVIEEATEAYRDEQDELRDFIEDRCVVNPTTWALADQLYGNYKEWAKVAGLRYPLTQKSFGAKLRKRGFVNRRVKIDGVAKWKWFGIAIATSLAVLDATHSEPPSPTVLDAAPVPEQTPPVPDVENDPEPHPDLPKDPPVPDGSGLPPALLTMRAQEESYENALRYRNPAHTEPAPCSTEPAPCSRCGAPAHHLGTGSGKDLGYLRLADTGEALCRPCAQRVGKELLDKERD